MKHHLYIACGIIIALSTLSTCTTVTQPKKSEGSTALTTKVWLISGYAPTGTLLPIEPGHGSSARLILQGNNTLSGTTGSYTFEGTWKAGKPNAAGEFPFSAVITKVQGQEPANAIASRFEADLIRLLKKTSFVRLGRGNIHLMDKNKAPTLQYIHRSADAP